MKQKKVFNMIFIMCAFLLMILPFLVSFNQILTDLVEKFVLYKWMQDNIVPVEVKMVTIIVGIVGFKNIVPYTNGFGINGEVIVMTWNCIGWQSLLLLAITLYLALNEKDYSLNSTIETIGIGLLGTFFVNLMRLSFIIILYEISRPIYAIVYHDYLAALVTVIWLVFFWWFSYRFVLEEKK